MLNAVLHTGIEHPDLLWVVVPCILTFAGGVAIGLRAKELETERDRIADTD